ncbi:MAG: TIGR04219 family outer membrane beta-barrel protein [Gammaproteobacteria bacterium]|nr:TIGR04219 family outer membrane beta-barrel protein [Gammaproteobacteria bacterium]
MKIKQLFFTLALTASFTANADTLSVSVGGGVWNQSPSGTIEKIGDPSAVDINNQLFWGDESQGYLFATLEHPVPLIPNVKLMKTTMDQSGSGIANFRFNGTDYNGNVTNDFSMETLDLYAYYEILDNVVSLDIGLDIRKIKVDYTISATGSPTTTDSVDETVPMLYAMVGATPWPDLTVSGELSYISYDGSTVSDFIAKVSYTTSFLVGVEAGYRKSQYTLDDVSDTNTDLSFDGVFAGAYLKF